MKLICVCLFIAGVLAEAPFGGYPPSGWRPQGAQFRLPTEYGAPFVQEKVDVEISKGMLAHIAQVVETTTEEYVDNEYLPPTTTEQPDLDPIRVQGLPDNQFRDFQRPIQQPVFPLSGQLRVGPNKNVHFGRQQQAQQVQTYGAPNKDEPKTDDESEDQYKGFPQNFRFNTATEQEQNQQVFPQNGQFKAQQASKYDRFGRQQQIQPARIYGVPDQGEDGKYLTENQYQDFQKGSTANRDAGLGKPPVLPLSGQLRAIPAKKFQFSQQQQTAPAPAYGTSDKDYNDSGDQEESNSPKVPDSDDDEVEDSSRKDPNEPGDVPVLAIANSFSGQYYILGTDSTLQRVMYATSQSDDDRRNMGFTARLRYSQVEPIRGPVYAYNEQGQLVRIYK